MKPILALAAALLLSGCQYYAQAWSDPEFWNRAMARSLDRIDLPQSYSSSVRYPDGSRVRVDGWCSGYSCSSRVTR